MTDEEFREHVATVSTLEQRVALNQQKATRLTAYAAMVAGLCVLIALVVLALVWRDGRNADASASSRIGQLTQQLDETRDALKIASASTSDNLECARRFAAVKDAALAEYLGSIGDLVVVISTNAPGPDREAAIGDKVQALAERLAEYREAIAAVSDWNAAAVQLPCPI